MLEGIILGLVVFAAIYTFVMRVMARRADVLYGQYVQQTPTLNIRGNDLPG